MSSIEKAKLNIGGLALPYGLVVAPMAGISDRTFRRLCMEKGAEYSVSEMVCAKALVYEQRCKKTDAEHFKTGVLASVMKDDLPMAVQIFGGDPEFIAEATRLIISHPEAFVDYEITKGKMDDVFLAVTGKKLTGGEA